MSDDEHERPFKCDDCGERFAVYSKFKQHQQIHTGEKPFACDKCDKTFRLRQTLRKHIDEYHLCLKPFKCEYCGKDFARQFRMKLHVKSFHENGQADLETTDPSQGNANGNNFKCDECDRWFKHPAGLIAHKRTQHIEQVILNCPYCEKTFKNDGLLQVHITRLHREKRPEGYFKKDEDYPFKCPDCTKMFQVEKRFKEHLRKHDRNKGQFTCLDCKEEFTDKFVFHRHVRENHPNYKKHACKFCDQRFWNSSGLAEHEMKHTGEFAYQCQYCDAKFRAKNTLTYHERTHTGERPFSCEKCGRTFTTSYIKKNHEEACDGTAEEKTHECEACGLKMTSASALKFHFAHKHTDETPFACEFCDKKFKLKPLLQKHRKAEHRSKISREEQLTKKERLKIQRDRERKTKGRENRLKEVEVFRNETISQTNWVKSKEINVRKETDSADKSGTKNMFSIFKKSAKPVQQPDTQEDSEESESEGDHGASIWTDEPATSSSRMPSAQVRSPVSKRELANLVVKIGDGSILKPRTSRSDRQKLAGRCGVSIDIDGHQSNGTDEIAIQSDSENTVQQEFEPVVVNLEAMDVTEEVIRNEKQNQKSEPQISKPKRNLRDFFATPKASKGVATQVASSTPTDQPRPEAPETVENRKRPYTEVENTKKAKQIVLKDMKDIPGLKTSTGGYFAQIESLIETCREFHGAYRVPLDNITFAASYTSESDTDIRKLAEELVETGIKEDQLSGLIGIISKNDTKEPLETWSVLLMEKQNVVSALRYIRCKPKMLEASPEWLKVESPCLPVELVGVPVGFFRSCSKHLSASGIHEMRVCMSAVLYEQEHVRDTTVLKAVRKIHDLKNSETTKHWNDFAKKGVLSTKGSFWMPVFLVCSSSDEIYNKVLEIVSNYQKENKETKKRLLKTKFMMKIIKLLYENRKNLNSITKQLEAMEKVLRKNGTEEIITVVPTASEVKQPVPSSSKVTPKRSRNITQEEPAEQTPPITSVEPTAKRARRSAGTPQTVVSPKVAKSGEKTKQPETTNAKKPPVARKTRRSNEKPAEVQETEQVQVVLPDVEKAEAQKVGAAKLDQKPSPSKRKPPTPRTTRRSRGAAEAETSTVELPNVEMEENNKNTEEQEPSTTDEPMETAPTEGANDKTVDPINQKIQSDQSDEQEKATTSDADEENANIAVEQMETDEASKDESIPEEETQNEPVQNEEPEKESEDQTENAREASTTPMEADLVEPETAAPTEEAAVLTEDDHEAVETENESEKSVEPEHQVEETSEAVSETSRDQIENHDVKEKSTEPTESTENVDQVETEENEGADETLEDEEENPLTPGAADYDVATPKTPEAVIDATDSEDEKSSTSSSSSSSSNKDSSDGPVTPAEQNEAKTVRMEQPNETEAVENHEDSTTAAADDQRVANENPEVKQETQEEKEQKHVPTTMVLPSSVELSGSPLADALSMRVTLESDDLYVIWVEKLDMDLLTSVLMNAAQCLICVKDFQMITESNEIRNALPTEDREMTNFSLLESTDDVIQWTAISFAAELRPLPAELKNKLIDSYSKVEELLEDNCRGWDIFHLANYSKEGFFPRLASQLQNNMLACNYSRYND